MKAKVFDHRINELGEGPLWHPMRKQLFWFDIVNSRMRSQQDGKQLEWQFDRMVSAAGWVDETRLLIASERDLFVFDVETNTENHVCDLETDDPVTRSNDGRADPQGGFWIGTMGKSAERGAGAIYRFYRGELRKLHDNITISNAISFAPDGKTAYFTDTATGIVQRQSVDPETGWPISEPEVFRDFKVDRRNPDGAVVDADGNIWIAEWGASRVSCYDPSGSFVKAAEVNGRHSSCPAFGGEDLTTLFVTTAMQDIQADVAEREPDNGKVFAITGVAPGQAEHQVVI